MAKMQLSEDNEWVADGISVRADGADETLVVLWDDTYIRVGTIRDLCRKLADDEYYDEAPLPVQVYVRDGDQLEKVDLVRLNHGTWHQVGILRSNGEVVCRGSYHIRTS